MRVASSSSSALVALRPRRTRSARRGNDWPRFGYDTARHDVAARAARITAANVAQPQRAAGPARRHGRLLADLPARRARPRRVRDVFSSRRRTGGPRRSTPHTGKVLWRFTPPRVRARSRARRRSRTRRPRPRPTAPRSTRPRPTAGSASSACRDGKVLWTTAITRDPTHEKLTSSLNVSRGLVIATTGGYIGDAPPYQGHVVTMSERTGRIAHVWNSLCSDRHALIAPSTLRARATRRSGRATAPRSTRRTATSSSRPATRPWNGEHRLGRQRARPLARRVAAARGTGRPPNQRAPERVRRSTSARRAPRLLAAATRCRAARTASSVCSQLHRLPGVEHATRRRAADASDARRRDAVQRAGGLEGQVGVRRDDARDRGAGCCSGGRLHPVWSNGNGGTSPVARRQPALRRGQRLGARLRADERQAGRDAAVGRRALAEPDRRRRPRRRRRGQRERPRRRPACWTSTGDDEGTRRLRGAARDPSPARPARARARCISSASRRFRRPSTRRAAPGEPGAPLRRRAGRAASSCSRAAASRDAVPRHPPAGLERRRAGPALGRLRPRVRDESALLRRLHRRERRHARRALPVGRHAGDPFVGEAAALRQGLRAQPQRRPAAVRAGRPALLGKRRRRRRRRSRAQRPEPRAAVREDHAAERRTSRGRAGSSSPTGCATRGASRSTARTATSTSATSARTSGRRSTTCSAAPQPIANFGWNRFEGDARLRRLDRPARREAATSPPVAEYPHSRRLLGLGRLRLPRQARARRRRPLLLRRLLLRDGLEPARSSAAARRTLRREPFSLKGLSSFAEDAAGELYLMSVDSGGVYRLAG